MAMTVGDFFWQRLWDWGVRRVFGYPGDGINGIVAAFGKADDDPKFVQTLHEEMAAFMATGAYAQNNNEVTDTPLEEAADATTDSTCSRSDK